MHRVLIVFSILFFILISNLGICTASGSERQLEYEVKAAFLYYFTQFIDWDEQAYPSSDSDFYIGVYGENPFGDYIDKIIADKTANGRKIRTIYSENLGDLLHCQIVFLCPVNSQKITEICDKLHALNILTVSDQRDFYKSGGIIGFILKKNKVGIEVSAKTAKQANLHIRSKLLKLAHLVDGE